MRIVWVIMRKEWSEVFRNRLVLFTVGLLPLLLTALPLGLLAGLGAEAFAGEEIPASFAALCQGLPAEQCGAYFLVNQFLILFLIMPLAIPVTIASYSIVGEKVTRTLEPLLATPISTLQLLGGKAAAAVAPGVAAMWFCYAVFGVGLRFVTTPEVAARAADPMWLLAVFVVGPLLSLAGVSVAVMVSSRTSEPRVAEQVSMLVILPLMGLLIGQVAGLILLNAQLVVVLAAGLALVDAGLLAFAVNLFQRETILTRWR
jgi:ABC-2 type transport system permease protein